MQVKHIIQGPASEGLWTGFVACNVQLRAWQSGHKDPQWFLNCNYISNAGWLGDAPSVRWPMQWAGIIVTPHVYSILQMMTRVMTLGLIYNEKQIFFAVLTKGACLVLWTLWGRKHNHLSLSMGLWVSRLVQLESKTLLPPRQPHPLELLLPVHTNWRCFLSVFVLIGLI